MLKKIKGLLLISILAGSLVGCNNDDLRGAVDIEEQEAYESYEMEAEIDEVEKELDINAMINVYNQELYNNGVDLNLEVKEVYDIFNGELMEGYFDIVCYYSLNDDNLEGYGEDKKDNYDNKIECIELMREFLESDCYNNIINEYGKNHINVEIRYSRINEDRIYNFNDNFEEDYNFLNNYEDEGSDRYNNNGKFLYSINR